MWSMTGVGESARFGIFKLDPNFVGQILHDLHWFHIQMVQCNVERLNVED